MLGASHKSWITNANDTSEILKLNAQQKESLIRGNDIHGKPNPSLGQDRKTRCLN